MKYIYVCEGYPHLTGSFAGHGTKKTMDGFTTVWIVPVVFIAVLIVVGYISACSTDRGVDVGIAGGGGGGSGGVGGASGFVIGVDGGFGFGGGGCCGGGGDGGGRGGCGVGGGGGGGGGGC